MRLNRMLTNHSRIRPTFHFTLVLGRIEFGERRLDGVEFGAVAKALKVESDGAVHEVRAGLLRCTGRGPVRARGNAIHRTANTS